jgi:hypothetical protein
MSRNFNVDPLGFYDGPEFDEFCISEKGYVRASRDRTGCSTCSLANLCQAGFEEQVRRVEAGEDPSLTKGCTLSSSDLTPAKLFSGLREDQVSFIKYHVPSLTKEYDDDQ